MSSSDPATKARTRLLSLRLVLIVPFLLQLFAAVGLTGWLSLSNGQRAVDEAISQVREGLTRRTREYLSRYLETAHRINQLNAYAIELGQLDERDPVALGRHFWHQLEEFESAAYIFLGSPHGGTAGAGRTGAQRTVDRTELDAELGLVAGTRSEFSTDETGYARELIDARPGMDARQRPWYQAAVTAEDDVWTDVYPLFSSRSLAIAACKPLYYEDGGQGTKRLRAVLAVDLTLHGIGEFLRELEVGRTGEVFVVEPTGHLVATSAAQDPFILDGEQMQRQWAVDHEEPLIAEATRLLAERFGGLHRVRGDELATFEIGGERQFVQASPIDDVRGLDWLIVTVVPEADFMDRIHANTRNTIWLCLAALVVATALGLVTSRWIARPIQHLNEASKALVRGEWDHAADAGGVREVGELAGSFNHMAGELRRSFRDLEERVEQRTAELRDAVEAADAANQAKSQFLANVSHELRTPLSAVLGYVELLRAKRLPAESDGWLRTIRNNGHHLDQLLSDLLDISRIEAGRFDLHVKPCELAELLAQLSSAFEPAAAERGLDLDIVTREWLPWRFEADPVRLRQVLSNLLANAVKYTHKGEVRLAVECDVEPDDLTGRDGAAATLALAESGPTSVTLVFSVTDTGPGIAPEDQERLFERFTRLETAGGGFGLGLAITRQLVDLMGGAVTVESRIGVGSVFTARIPVEGCRDWAQEERGYEKSGHILLPALPALKGRVLIADDSTSLRDLCLQMLERWGLECESATNGLEALEQATRRRFDAVLMDWQMPEMDGLEATLQLRRRGVGSPIIALTASAMSGDREKCLAAGCDDYLTKPIDFKELHRLLVKILERDPAAAGVLVDQEVAALSRRYLLSLPEKLIELRGVLARSEWKPFNTAVHKLVGTVGTYQLEEVFRLAEELEQVAEREDAAAAAALLDQLAATVDRATAKAGLTE